MFKLLEGKNVNLRVVERDDTDFMFDCFNNMDFWGEYDFIVEQKSKTERMKQFDNPSNLATLTSARGGRWFYGVVDNWGILSKKMGKALT